MTAELRTRRQKRHMDASTSSGFATFAGVSRRRATTAGRHPLYIVSKGRWDTQMTSKALTDMNVPHHVVVEQAEVDLYRERGRALGIDLAEYVVLDPAFQRDYDALGDFPSPGSGAARNFAWEHSIALGAEWHWVMDDNIQRFHRFNRNVKTPVADGTVFRCMEDFCERYENVAMAGPNYFMFAYAKDDRYPPFYLNTRIYSCNLIRNDVPFRWRGRYNEDTILSLDMLKAGWCTILFMAFLQFKMVTQTMKGGNTDELYAQGTYDKSKMLVDAHPDVASLVWRHERWHHEVDYPRIARHNVLRRRPDVEVREGVDNYGMILERIDQQGVWHRMAADEPRYPWE
jgi:hypothetical protein